MTTTLLTPPRIDDATRRQFLGGAALAALLAGCGSGPVASETTVGGGAFPVTIEHRYGSTVIPAEPTRVVSVGIGEVDPMLALGVVPVAVTDYYAGGGDQTLPWPWAATQQGDAEIEVLPEVPINVERIAALASDLILGTSSGMEAADYTTLTSIAPTVAQSPDHPNFSTPLEVELRTIGRAVGRVRQADDLIASLDRRFADARAQYPEFASATAVHLGGPFEGQVRVYAPESRVGILTMLGFRPFPVTAELERTNAFFLISQERLDLVDHDLLLWPLYSVPQAEVEALPLYGKLDAVKEGRVVFVEAGLLRDALTINSVLSLPYALDLLLPRLAAGVDGDPATEVPA